MSAKTIQAPCIVCREAVTTHKYVQIIPLHPMDDDAEVEQIKQGEVRQPADVVQHAETGEFWRLPRPTDSRRLQEKRFCCLNHNGEEMVESLDLDDEAIFELRHRPPRHVTLVDPSLLETTDMKNRTALLTDGRHVQLLQISGGKAEVDFGVLLKARVFGRQLADLFADWQQKLIQQLMA